MNYCSTLELLHLQQIKLFYKKNVTQYLVRYWTAIASTARWARVITSNKQGMACIGDCDKQMLISGVVNHGETAIGYRVQKGFRASYHQVGSNCSF
jgi:hypothetical protein